MAELVAKLHADGRARETIKESTVALAQVFDHASVEPNSARGVKLPREERDEIAPPTADHVEACVRLLPSRYRLPLLVLDATAMRVGELEQLRWGDVDEREQRWRVSRSVEKTRWGRWVPVPEDLLVCVLALQPRDDRDPSARVFAEVTADRLRTAIAGMRGGGRPSVQPSRSASPADLAVASQRDLVGGDRWLGPTSGRSP